MQTNNLMESLTFTVPLSGEAHQIAHRFRQQQLNAQCAKQVYLNTLSVYAVNFYLKCMDFYPDWQSSDSFNPMMQKFSDVADLNVRNIGKFECRPVLPNQQVLSVPLESWKNRRGFFAVQLNAALTEATILGFIKQVTTEETPLSQLQSLDFFLKYASQLENSVKLQQWLQNMFEAGWETVDTVLSSPKMAFRSGNISPENSQVPATSETGVERIKLLNLERTGEQVGLLVRLEPRTESEMGIGVEIYPSSGQTYLPQDLQLMVLDQGGEAVMQAAARSTKNVQLQFSAESGEEFSVKVALGEVSIIETFLI